MEENKINFLCPTSPTNSIVQTNFVNPICPLSQEQGLGNFSVASRQVPISQIYTSRKIKHPSFRKRASSGTMPYYIPFRHRQRTKSENADANPQQSQDASMECCENVNDKNLASMDMDNVPSGLHASISNPQFNKIKLSQLKKSKSMESLLPPKADDKESTVNSSSSTLEFVSHRIQKLKFNE